MDMLVYSITLLGPWTSHNEFCEINYNSREFNNLRTLKEFINFFMPVIDLKIHYLHFTLPA